MKELFVFFLSAMPISELRGAIPIALGFGISPEKTFLICFLGNLAPVPFLLLFLEKVKKFILRFGFAKKWYEKIEKRTLKRKGIIEKYGYMGLVLLVAVPLPGTGAWTGSLLAALLNLEFKKSLVAISLGVFAAGVIVLSASLGLLALPKILI